MKNTLLLLAGAALTLASCSQEKTTATADGGAMTTTTTTTTAGVETAEAMEARAQRIADKMVADMKITDEATKTKIRTAYLNRARRMGEMRTKYTTDTTGMAAAMRSGAGETDTEFKTIFTDPTQYQSYESSRTSYDDSNFMDAGSAAGTGNTSADGSMSSGGSMSGSAPATGADQAASAMSNPDNTKVKVQADGDIKIKDADGNKMKVDGDDGTVKLKPKDGEKTKIE